MAARADLNRGAATPTKPQHRKGSPHSSVTDLLFAVPEIAFIFQVDTYLSLCSPSSPCSAAPCTRTCAATELHISWIRLKDAMNYQNGPLVSLVTPVYNGEKYLAECIESVLGQTYQNWDYVIVNNCSQDRSLEIAQSHAAKDSRIRIHNNGEFLGALDNWNHALRQISPDSKYCKEIHADDWLFPEFLERMVAVAEAHPSVGIVSSYRLCNNAVDCDGLYYPSPITAGREVSRLHLLGKLFAFGSPSTLLMRSDLVRARPALFQPVGGQTDVAACYELLQESDFGFVHQVLSFTRVHSSSLSEALGRLHHDLPEKLLILQRYGPVYLQQDEFKQRWNQLMEQYSKVLRESTFEIRGKKFWDFHREQRARLGVPITRGTIAWWMALSILRVIFKPITIGISQLYILAASKKSPTKSDPVLGLFGTKTPQKANANSRAKEPA